MAATANQRNKELRGTRNVGSNCIVKLRTGESITIKNSSDSNIVYLDDTQSSITYGNVTVNLFNNGTKDVIQLIGLGSYANDAAAAADDVGVGDLYINSSTGAITQRLV